jgi:hypothetical protein
VPSRHRLCLFEPSIMNFLPLITLLLILVPLQSIAEVCEVSTTTEVRLA